MGRSLASFLLAITLSAGMAQDPLHRRFGSAEGLPSDLVYCAAEDEEGLLWFGTDAGAARFDGVRFERYTQADGLTDSEIIGIRRDRADRMWFLTLNGLPCFWKEGVFHHPGNTPWLRGAKGSSGWHTFVEAHDGTLWFAGIRGEVMALRPGVGMIHHQPANGAMRSVLADEHGHVFLLVGDSLVRWAFNDWVRTGSRLERITVMSAQQEAGPRGTGVILSTTHVVRLRRERWMPLGWTHGLVDPERHVRMYLPDTTELWLIDSRSGVTRHSSAGRPSVHWFRDHQVTTLFKSARGDLWVGTRSNGVLFVDSIHADRTRLLVPDAATAGGATAIALSRGQVMVGSQLGGLFTVTPEGLRPLAGRPPRFPGLIRRIIPDKDDGLWIVADHGVFRWDAHRKGHWWEARLSHQRDPSKDRHVPAKTAIMDSTGALITIGNGCYRIEWSSGGYGIQSQGPEWIAAERVNCLAMEYPGVFWVDRAHELLRMEGNGVVAVSLSSVPVGGRISDVVHVAGGRLLIGTAGHGLVLREPDGREQVFGTGQGLPTDVIRRLRVQGDTVLIATPRGACSAHISAHGLHGFRTWSTQHGLPSDDVRDVIRSGQEILIATAAGIIILPDERRDGAPVPLTLRPVSIDLNGRTVPWPETELALRTGDRLTLTYHAVEFGSASAVEYMYRRNNSPWRSCERGRVVLDELTDQDRVIQVRARLPGMPWSVTKVLRMHVEPVWYKRWYVSALGLGLLFLFTVGWFQWRQRRQALVHRAAMEKAMALAEERRRIAADIHDDLGAELSHLLMRSKAASKVSIHSGGISEGLERALGRIDEIIWSLDPRRDTLRATASFIEKQATELLGLHNIAYRAAMELPSEQDPLKAEHRRAVLLIVREALRNAVTHARCTEVLVAWSLKDGTAECRVEDNGCGMTIQATATGRNGLANMRARAAGLGGIISWGPGEEGGTIVTLRWPLRTESPDRMRTGADGSSILPA